MDPPSSEAQKNQTGKSLDDKKEPTKIPKIIKVAD
jgi:hypothetical protein